MSKSSMSFQFEYALRFCYGATLSTMTFLSRVDEELNELGSLLIVLSFKNNIFLHLALSTDVYVLVIFTKRSV